MIKKLFIRFYGIQAYHECKMLPDNPNLAYVYLPTKYSERSAQCTTRPFVEQNTDGHSDSVVQR